MEITSLSLSESENYFKDYSTYMRCLSFKYFKIDPYETAMQKVLEKIRESELS